MALLEGFRQYKWSIVATEWIQCQQWREGGERERVEKEKKKNLTCFNSDNKIGRKLKLKHKLVDNLKTFSLVSFIFPNVVVRSLTQS